MAETIFQIINPKKFLNVKSAGVIDLDQSKQTLSKLAAISNSSGHDDILLDVRELLSSLSFEELGEMVLDLSRNHLLSTSRVAILARDDEQFHKAIFIEMCANLEMLTMGAFNDYEKAILWLQSSAGVEALFD